MARYRVDSASRWAKPKVGPTSPNVSSNLFTDSGAATVSPYTLSVSFTARHACEIAVFVSAFAPESEFAMAMRP